MSSDCGLWTSATQGNPSRWQRARIALPGVGRTRIRPSTRGSRSANSSASFQSSPIAVCSRISYLARTMAAKMPVMTSEQKGLRSVNALEKGKTSPSTPVLRVTRLWASGLGTYRSCAAAVWMRLRVSSPTRILCRFLPLSTAETAETEVPASLATSRMVAGMSYSLLPKLDKRVYQSWGHYNATKANCQAKILLPVSKALRQDKDVGRLPGAGFILSPHPRVDLLRLGGDMVPVEDGLDALIGAVGHLARERRVLQHAQKAPGQTLRIVYPSDRSRHVVEDDFRQAAGIGDDHRHASGHRLQRHDSERLIEAGKAGHVGHLVETQQLVVGNKAGEVDVRADPQGLRLVFEVLVVAAACHDQFGVVVAGPHLRQRRDQHLRAFFPHAPPHEQDQLLIGRGVLCAESRGFVRGEREIELLGVDTVIDHVQFIGRGLQGVLDLALHKTRADDDAPGFPHELPFDAVDIA